MPACSSLSSSSTSKPCPTDLRIPQHIMEKEEEEEDIFTAWPAEDEEQDSAEEPEEQEDEEEETGRKRSLNIPRPSHLLTKRRASLPCPDQLSAMQLTNLTYLARLHAATMAPAPAHVRQHTRNEEEDKERPLHERRPPAIPTIPEVLEPPERKLRFRSRNVMSLSDADSLCLICHDDLRKGGGSIRELHCSHSFHTECIEEWLWTKQTCPTCRKHVAMPEPLYWTSTRVKVP
ncbi:E3 ubiquitin-protein ligase CIP8 isoform X1 [Pygocentrus nattereri]|uniref:E3 ubiquitin-protein ligase CIP8 isoform X1 n=2 Tax=Pygocentrus nattereri TaxID=42514 RepID=UPI00081465BA|nr:E3 ubiquitin-protein ligase CIP8 isoform X1 [Pygocentrus nattereri]